LLLRRKRRATAGREDLPLDGAAVLLGRGHIDRVQFDELGRVTSLLRQIARGWRLRDSSVTGIWSALAAAAARTRYHTVNTTPAGAEGARYALGRRLRQLDGSHALVIELAEGRIPPLVAHVLERALTPQDEADLVRLRAGLDGLAGQRRSVSTRSWWPSIHARARQRRQPRLRGSRKCFPCTQQSPAATGEGLGRFRGEGRSLCG
jgi:hypothetical protein